MQNLAIKCNQCVITMPLFCHYETFYPSLRGSETTEAIHNAIESNNMDCHDSANAKSRNDRKYRLQQVKFSQW